MEKVNRLPLISIQILNWNRAEETQRAIRSAIDQTYPNIEIVVVDNGSTDNSVALAKANYPQIKVIELHENYGCPDGRNRGIKYCEGEFIFYLDNDGVLHKDAVEKAYQVIKEDNSIAIIAGVVYDFDDVKDIDTSIIPKSIRRYEHNNFQGGICMHRKSIYSIIGSYPEHFFYGGEEWYLTCKILDNNMKIIKDESIILWHKRSDRARNREKELINAYYNKLYVCLSLYPIKYALSFMFYFPLRYPKFAKKEGIMYPFIKSLFTRYLGVVYSAFTNREPIRKSTYNLLKNG